MNEPKVGEWWMCQSETARTCPMIKVKNGWGSISDKSGNVESSYVQKKGLTPLFQMVKAVDTVAYFGAHLIDHHEGKFPGGENEIQLLCVDVLDAFEADLKK